MELLKKLSEFHQDWWNSVRISWHSIGIDGIPLELVGIHSEFVDARKNLLKFHQDWWDSVRVFWKPIRICWHSVRIFRSGPSGPERINTVSCAIVDRFHPSPQKKTLPKSVFLFTTLVRSDRVFRLFKQNEFRDLLIFADYHILKILYVRRMYLLKWMAS